MKKQLCKVFEQIATYCILGGQPNRLATLLSSLIARRLVGLQTL